MPEVTPIEGNLWLVILSVGLTFVCGLVLGAIKMLWTGNSKLIAIETKVDGLEGLQQIIEDHSTTLGYHSRRIATHDADLRWLKIGRGHPPDDNGKHGQHGDRE